MCRLLATVSARATTIEEVLGDTGLREFSRLSEFHDDGWGAARLDERGDIETRTSITKADADPDFERYTTSDRATEHLLHLRWASAGMGTVARNSHPFRREGYAFMHNGNIAAPRLLDELLDEDSRAGVRGGTDSERFFAYIMQCCRNSSSVEQGIIAAVKDIREAFPGRSLNSFLMHDGGIYVINCHAGAHLDLSAYPERVGHTPWQHDETHYLDLLVSRKEGSIAVASTGMRHGEWEKLPEESIFKLNKEDEAPSIRTIWEG